MKTICIGKTIIRTLANNGWWISDDLTMSTVAASELYQCDPYTRIEELEKELEESRKYADKLVNFLPCLPADVDNLREANLHFAMENERLLTINRELEETINDLCLDIISKDFELTCNKI